LSSRDCRIGDHHELSGNPLNQPRVFPERAAAFFNVWKGCGCTRSEQMLSALLLIAALEQTFQSRRLVPVGDIAASAIPWKGTTLFIFVPIGSQAAEGLK